MQHARMLAPLALVLAGCAAEAAPPPFTARDSSGVRIVEYADTPSTAPAFTVSTEPLYRVGDAPGEREFTAIAAGALLADGGAVVVDGMRNQELVLIAPDGDATIIARPGRGPAELANSRSIEVLGPGSFLVLDYLNQKMMVFQNGALARSVSTAADGPIARMFMPVGFEPPGTLLMGSSGYTAVMQEGWIQGTLVRFDLQSHALDTVGSFDMAPPRDREGPMNPFGPFGAFAGSGALFVTGRSDIPELTWRGPDGSVRQVLRWKSTPRHPTESNLTQLLERMGTTLTRVNPGASPEQIEQMVRQQRERYQLDTSQPFPLFGMTHGDGRGGVWLSEFPTDGRDPFFGIARWTVIAPDGHWLGSVTLPEGFRVLDVTPDRVLGVLRDEMDVESLAVFSLTEAAPSP